MANGDGTASQTTQAMSATTVSVDVLTAASRSFGLPFSPLFHHTHTHIRSPSSTHTYTHTHTLFSFLSLSSLHSLLTIIFPHLLFCLSSLSLPLSVRRSQCATLSPFAAAWRRTRETVASARRSGMTFGSRVQRFVARGPSSDRHPLQTCLTPPRLRLVPQVEQAGCNRRGRSFFN